LFSSQLEHGEPLSQSRPNLSRTDDLSYYLLSIRLCAPKPVSYSLAEEFSSGWLTCCVRLEPISRTQIYDPHNTWETAQGSIGVLHGDGYFEVFAAQAVVSVRVSVGVHPVKKERVEKRREGVQKLFAEPERAKRLRKFRARVFGAL
jgi:hypothetical protein